jgi:acyl-CoA synthetase (AMP-forming)/AMP-acid ligase II
MSDTTIHIGEMLARNARMYPDDIALVERIPAQKKRFEITWKQFDEEVNRFANVLTGKGIRKGDKVVHLMMNSIDWLIAYFGIIRTGAWVVPLNFRFTGKDIKYCIDVAEPKIILFGEEFTERIEEIKERIKVEEYIFAGNESPDFAESFKNLAATEQPAETG